MYSRIPLRDRKHERNAQLAMTGLRVVTPEGEKPGLGRALVRWAVFAVDGPLSLFICGIVTSSVSAGHRRLGDMAAGTYVIGKADVGRPVAVRPR